MRLNMAMDRANEDNRPRVGVYGIVRSEQDSLAQSLAVGFAFDNGWYPIEYVDKVMPRDNEPNAWSRLMGDISSGQLYGVIVRWHIKGLLDYCEQHNTKLCVLDRPLNLMPHSSGRRVSLI
jgi:hypothetical protein